METHTPSRWANVFLTLAWINMALGGIQMYVAGADWVVIVPGFTVLMLFALPEWLHRLQIPRRDESGS